MSGICCYLSCINRNYIGSGETSLHTVFGVKGWYTEPWVVDQPFERPFKDGPCLGLQYLQSDSSNSNERLTNCLTRTLFLPHMVVLNVLCGTCIVNGICNNSELNRGVKGLPSSSVEVTGQEKAMFYGALQGSWELQLVGKNNDGPQLPNVIVFDDEYVRAKVTVRTKKRSRTVTVQCKDVILHKGKEQGVYYIDFCGTTLKIKGSSKIEIITSLDTKLSGSRLTNPSAEELECLRYFGIGTTPVQPGYPQAQAYPMNQPFSPTAPGMERPMYDEYGNAV